MYESGDPHSLSMGPKGPNPIGLERLMCPTLHLKSRQRGQLLPIPLQKWDTPASHLAQYISGLF